MILNYYDSIMIDGYKKALCDLIDFIDNNSRFLKKEKVMNVPAVRSLLMCIYEEYDSFFTYGTFDRKYLCLSPAKDENGKKQDRTFFLCEQKYSTLI